ncbi:MAG TPA: type II toxin-antitoxin system RelE/ParE family toxin [Chloroflexota bacterium]|nr:type II toxin-antitoxin system RelE/ParE family toxin [Chloroflexota bacterium]
MRERFVAEAQAEFLGQIAYYSEARTGLGIRFSQAVEAAVARVLAFPNSGTPAPSNTRRVRVRGFPFSVVYRADAGDLTIFAVAHDARRSDYWISRVDP